MCRVGALTLTLQDGMKLVNRLVLPSGSRTILSCHKEKATADAAGLCCKMIEGPFKVAPTPLTVASNGCYWPCRQHRF